MSLFYRVILKFEKLVRHEQFRELRRSLKKCGEGVIIDPTCYILMPREMEIGDNTSISAYTTIYATFGVKIGSNCLISSNCGISSYNHIQNSKNRPASVDQDSQFSKSVIIGNNVWIGMNACVLPGVEIGNNSIIGSGSVVTKNVPANEVWVGNPARYVKTLNFLEEA